VLLIPSGLGVDDLLPAVRLAHELTSAGIPRARIAMALCRTGDAENEIVEAGRYITDAGYH